MPKSLATSNTFVSSLASIKYLMIGEMWAPSKGFATLMAFVRFLSRMNSLMKPEVWPFSGGLATFNTFVWLSFSIYFLMKLKCEHLLQILPYSLHCKIYCQYGLPVLNLGLNAHWMHTATLITLVSFLSSMNSLVINKVWILTKDFVTFIILHLQYESFARYEFWLNTLAHTFIWLFSSTDHLMCSEVWALSKAFATLITLERYHSNIWVKISHTLICTFIL